MTPTDKASALVGAGGFLSTVTLSTVNEVLASTVAVLTILALVPLAIYRWRQFLKNKHPDRNE